MKKLMLVAAAAALLFTSCASNKTVSYTRVSEPAVKNMAADIRVDAKKVTAKAEWDGKKRAIVNEDQLRQNAVYAALKKVDADVLLAPQFQVVTEIRGGHKFITVDVVGYPGFYNNFQPIEKAFTNAIETKELKSDASYLVTTKDNKGNVTGYQFILVDQKEECCAPVLTAEPAEMRVKLAPAGGCGHHGKKGAAITEADPTAVSKKDIFKQEKAGKPQPATAAPDADNAGKKLFGKLKKAAKK